MKLVIASAAALSLMAGAAMAQSTTNSTSSSANSNPSASSQAATAQKIKQDLQGAGFQDVNVVAESFLVQAKTKDGDPVVMTIGPHGMTMVEAMGAKSSPQNSSQNPGGQSGASSSTTSK